MPTEGGEESIRVIIAKDHMTVEMLIPAGFPRQTLTEQVCVSLLQQSGVEISQPVVEQVRAMIAQPPPPNEPQRHLIAQGQLPQQGEQAHIEWLVPDPADSKGNACDETDEADAQELSHYDRSVYIIVKAGETLGQIVQPTPGADGRDVLGQTIPAKPSKPVAVKLDETILQDASNLLIAQVDGVLHREPNKAYVRPLIEVPQYVDFSTGNIDFSGDVLVHRGVRDRFVVKAGGSVEVRGLIEAATIECGNNLIARGGMAGRERGQVKVGGNLVGKYLDNIQGEIKGDLEIQREILNCELVVHGSILSPRGTIIGGHTMVTGRVEVVALGSGAGVVTHLALGAAPRLEPIAVQLGRLIDQLNAKRDALEAEQKLMTKDARMMTSTDKERQTEIMFEYQTAVAKLSQALAAQEALTQRLAQQRTVDLLVHNKLFAGATITVSNQSFKVFNDLKGPIRVFMNPQGEVAYQKGDSKPGLMIQVAELKAAAA